MTTAENIKTINDAIPNLTVDELKTWDVFKLDSVATSIRKLYRTKIIDNAYAGEDKIHTDEVDAEKTAPTTVKGIVDAAYSKHARN